MRTSPLYYIDPSAISIIPNANGSANDLAVYIERGTKIKVYDPRIAALGTEDGSFLEWTISGRNRRLADATKPYTIYARLRKVTDFSDPDNVSAAMADGYLMFVPQDKETQEWNEEPYILTPNTSSTGGKSSTGADGKTYTWQPIPARQAEAKRTDYWWVKLGTVSEPEAFQRTVELDTGILGTEQWNAEWTLNPDELPLRIELECSIGGNAVGMAPYVLWGQQLDVKASLVEGWENDAADKVRKWTITRNSGNAQADEAWNHPVADTGEETGEESEETTPTERIMTDGQITLAHTLGDSDDFAAAVAATFTITAWGEKVEEEAEGTEDGEPADGETDGAQDQDDSQEQDTQDGEEEQEETKEPELVPLTTAVITVYAETIATYELELSAGAVTYNPVTQAYSPANGVAVRIRAKAQDGSIFYPDNAYITTAQLHVLYWPVDVQQDEESQIPELTLTDGRGLLPVSAFAAGKSINLWLENGAQAVLARNTVAYIRYGEKGDTPISIFRWYKAGLTPVKPTATNSEEPAPAATDATGEANVYPTDKWSKTMPDRPATGEWNLWQCNSVKHGSGTIDAWQGPVRVSGEKGDAGIDASDREYIYKRMDVYPFSGTLPANITTPDASSTGQTVADDDFVPSGWSDTALPAAADEKYVYLSIREKPAGKNQTWGPFSNPQLWSNWGVMGSDGDGVQYAYKLFDHELTDAERTSNIPARPSEPNANGEWTPQGWSDDPLVPTHTMPYCYCSVIRQINGTWGQFGKLGLWSNWADDGTGIVVASQSVTYCRRTAAQGPVSDPSTLTYGAYPPTLAKGDWLYSKTTVVYKTSDGADAGTTVAYSVSYIGQDGDNGPGISGITEHYKASAVSTGESTPAGNNPTDWGTNPMPADWNAQKPYLWNYEKIAKVDKNGNTTYERTTASVIAIWTENGRGVAAITNFYKKSALAAGEGYPAADPDGQGAPHSGSTAMGWNVAVQVPDADAPYLWNYERIKWVEKDGSNTYTYTTPHVIGHYGKDADVWTIGEDGYWYLNGVKTDTKAEGRDGTGVQLRGSVDVLYTASASAGQTSLQGLTGMNVGDCYVVNENRHLYFYDGTSQQEGVPDGWRDLGEFKGDPGDNSYVHIAYATDVTISGGTVTAVTGFSVVKQRDDYEWMGFCVDHNEEDPGADASTYAEKLAAAKKYAWNYVKGTPGATSVSIYKWDASDTTPPAVPSSLAYPPAAGTGWSASAPNRTNDYFLWMATGMLNTQTGTVGEWSTPVRISGDNGTPGEDAKEREWIYRVNSSSGYLSTNGTAKGEPVSGQTDGIDNCYLTDDFVPTNWNDNPSGVTNPGDIEYVAFRDYDKANGRWGAFNTPTIWSRYGRNGMDGDGVEYVYIRTKKNVAPVMDSTQAGYLEDEFRPTITAASQTAAQTEQAQTTDDPLGPNESYPFEWVATRRKADAAADGSRAWRKYMGKNNDYKMSLWSKWTDDADVWTIGEDGYWYLNGVKTGTKAEGRDGTGVQLRGSVDVLYTASASAGQTSLQGLTGMNVGDCYVVNENRHLYFYDGTSQQEGVPAGWRDLGEFKGDPGDNSYVHIAYATDVTISGGTVTAVTGFSVVKQRDDYEWMGFCVDHNEEDPGADASTYAEKLAAAKKYAWNYVKGTPGATSVSIYKWDVSDTTPPAVPSSLAYPPAAGTGWSASAPNRTNNYFLWMATGMLNTQTGTVGEWSTPVRISGDNGTPGEDAKEREWIYRVNSSSGYLSTNGTAKGEPVSGQTDGIYNCYLTDDFVPTNWNDNPSGVTNPGDIEYVAFRDYDKANGRWGAFNTPTIWSRYGRNGMDGDGVEYVYIRTKINVAPVIADSAATDSNGYEVTHDEYLPSAYLAAASGNIEVNDINASDHNNTHGVYACGECTDDPKGTDSTWKFEWMAKRTMGSAAASGARTWEAYAGTMKLWGNWSEDGESPWVADIDNEMDSVSCDDTGRPVRQQSVSTDIALYYGSQPRYFRITEITRNGSASMGTGVTIDTNPSNIGTTAAGSATITVTYGTTAKITGKDVFVITLQAADDSSVVRSLEFKVNGIIGDVYNLRPSVSQVNVPNGATTFDLRCGYKKNVEGTISSYDDCGEQIDSKYNIYLHRRNRSTGTWETTFYLYTNQTYRAYVTALDVETYDAVEFVLCTDTGSTETSLSNIVDRETVPVVRDGSNGSGADVMLQCTPGSMTVPCTSEGTAKANTSAQLTFSMTIDGTTANITGIEAAQKSSYVTVSGSGSTRTVSVPKDLPAAEVNKGIVFAVTGRIGNDGTPFTRSIAFPMVASPDGPKGDDAVEYSLHPTPTAINFRSNAVGDFTGSKSVVCRVRKAVGEVMTELDPAEEYPFEGKYRLYYFDQEESVWFAAVRNGQYYSISISADDASSGLITSIPFALSSAANSTDDPIDDSNTVQRIDVPVICDGRRGVPGETGTAGKMFYSMGEWEAKSYTRSDLFVPMVHYNDGEFSEATGEGNYYYLNADSATANDVPGTSNKWTKAEGFGVVITQGLFAEFAKLGRGIISGDYIFSMNGRIGNTEYNNGADGPNGKPAYSYFDPNFLLQTEMVIANSQITINKYYLTTNWQLLGNTFRLTAGVRYTFTFVGRRGSGNLYVRLYKDGQQVTDAGLGTISGTSDQTVTLTYTPETTEDGYELKASTVTSGTYGYIKSAKVTAADTFQPNWWVDLLTGRMSAARGNFVVNPDGTIVAAGGNFTVNNNSVEIQGTIRATNFYNKICYFYDGGTCFGGGEPYTKGGLSYATAGMADIVMFMPTTTSSAWSNSGNSGTVLLPDPSTCDGKMVTIYCHAQTIAAGGVPAIGCVASNKFASAWSKGSNGLTPSGQTDDSLTLSHAYAVKTYKITSGSMADDSYKWQPFRMVLISQNGYWFKLE